MCSYFYGATAYDRTRPRSGEGGGTVRRYGLQEWLRVHIETLPERQAAREAERAQRQAEARERTQWRPFVEKTRRMGTPTMWGAGLILEPLDAIAKRSTSRKNQQRARGKS